jgi:hypothetical protein
LEVATLAVEEIEVDVRVAAVEVEVNIWEGVRAAAV